MSTHYGILLHVVFSTKYRKPLIADSWRDDLFAYIGGIVKEHMATLLKAGGIEDHVHLLLRIHPEYAISKTVQILKTNSSKWINDTEKTSIPFQWQRGYGASSVISFDYSVILDHSAKPLLANLNHRDFLIHPDGRRV